MVRGALPVARRRVSFLGWLLVAGALVLSLLSSLPATQFSFNNSSHPITGGAILHLGESLDSRLVLSRQYKRDSCIHFFTFPF